MYILSNFDDLWRRLQYIQVHHPFVLCHACILKWDFKIQKDEPSTQIKIHFSCKVIKESFIVNMLLYDLLYMKTSSQKIIYLEFVLSFYYYFVIELLKNRKFTVLKGQDKVSTCLSLYFTFLTVNSQRKGRFQVYVFQEILYKLSITVTV